MTNLFFDVSIAQYLNTQTMSFPFMTGEALFFASYLQYFLGVALLYFIYTYRKEKIAGWKVSAVALIAGAVARLIVKPVTLLLYERARPYVEYPDIHVLVDTFLGERYQSFPSGHALFFFAISAVIYKYNHKWGAFFFMSSILMGMARVAVGLHYPTDIVGGAVLGILCGGVVLFVSKKFFAITLK